MKNKIMNIFNEVKGEQKSWAPDGYPVRISTFSLKVRLENKYPLDKWSCKTLRKQLSEMHEVEKDIYHSRRGNTVWRLVQ